MVRHQHIEIEPLVNSRSQALSKQDIEFQTTETETDEQSRRARSGLLGIGAVLITLTLAVMAVYFSYARQDSRHMVSVKQGFNPRGLQYVESPDWKAEGFRIKSFNGVYKNVGEDYFESEHAILYQRDGKWKIAAKAKKHQALGLSLGEGSLKYTYSDPSRARSICMLRSITECSNWEEFRPPSIDPSREADCLDWCLTEGTVHKVSESSRYGGRITTWWRPLDNGNLFFSDNQDYGQQAWGIRNISVKFTCGAGQLAVGYSSGLVIRHGWDGGGVDDLQHFMISDDEYITNVKIVARKRVDGIQFTLNNGRQSPLYGANFCIEDPKPFTYHVAAPDGYGVMAFKGNAGRTLSSIGFYYGTTPAACNSIASVTGQWLPDVYKNDAFARQVERGTTAERMDSKETNWGMEATKKVAQGYFFFGSNGSISVGTPYAKSTSEAYSKAFSMMGIEKEPMSFTTGGQLWKWVFTTVDPCGESKTVQDYVMTRNVAEPPCCPVGWALDPYTQFGECAAGAPNACTDSERTSTNYNVQMRQSNMVDFLSLTQEVRELKKRISFT